MAGILIAGAGATLFTAALRTRVVQAFRIPSASMAPVLVPGDYLFANKSPGAAIARGDVVVYRHPANPSQEFIHRVVAVPGDEVEIRAKRLIVNGATPDEPYAWHADTTMWVAAESSRDHFGPLKLGGDAYFVLGDNRDNANDSRFLGPVRREAIRGRATNRYWPPARWGAVR
jgi:signal peptidase I